MLGFVAQNDLTQVAVSVAPERLNDELARGQCCSTYASRKKPRAASSPEP